MNYEKLYHIAFNAATDAIRFIDAGDCAAARETLVKVQQEAEEIYINTLRTVWNNQCRTCAIEYIWKPPQTYVIIIPTPHIRSLSHALC